MSDETTDPLAPFVEAGARRIQLLGCPRGAEETVVRAVLETMLAVDGPYRLIAAEQIGYVDDPCFSTAKFRTGTVDLIEAVWLDCGEAVYREVPR